MKEQAEIERKKMGRKGEWTKSKGMQTQQSGLKKEGKNTADIEYQS
jgi:hypothetical protein